MFDTHCHLNLPRLLKNVEEIVAGAKNSGISQILVPGVNLETSRKAIELAGRFEGVFAAVGIHPEDVSEYVEQKMKNEEQVLAELEILLNNPKVVAIGEIGLDRFHLKDDQDSEKLYKEQKELFICQLSLAKKHSKPIILHCREASDNMLDILTHEWDSSFENHSVLHCCEPIQALFDFAKGHHMYLGIDGNLTYAQDKPFDSALGKAEFIKKVPLDMLVLETDSPFLLPEPLKSEKKYPNVPANLGLIAEEVARLKEISLEEVIRVTAENGRNLFKLAPHTAQLS
ncbi:MAG: TatD family hydrolase [Candidatus Roizmanbacteria bacterium]